MGHLHIAGSTSLSMGSVLSRGLVFHAPAPSNRDQIRDFQNGTVTKTVIERRPRGRVRSNNLLVSLVALVWRRNMAIRLDSTSVEYGVR